MLYKVLEKNGLSSDQVISSNKMENELVIQLKDKAVIRDNGNHSSYSNFIDKEKSSGKMSHYLNEMRKELDAVTKQRKEMVLEMQQLREKCNRLEDQLSVEQSKVATIEERLARSKASKKALLMQIETQNVRLEKQQIICSQVENATTSSPSNLHNKNHITSNGNNDGIETSNHEQKYPNNNISTHTINNKQLQPSESLQPNDVRPVHRSLSFDAH